jgi:hypothetical protein
MLIDPLMAVSPDFTTRNKLQITELDASCTGKKTKQLDGEGGPANSYNCPLVTKPYRDPANVDKLKMLYPPLRASTTVTTNPITRQAKIFTLLKPGQLVNRLFAITCDT